MTSLTLVVLYSSAKQCARQSPLTIVLQIYSGSSDVINPLYTLYIIHENRIQEILVIR